MDMVFLAFFQYLAQKIDLQHALAARKGHTAAGGFVKRLVFLYQMKNLFDRVWLSADLFCVIETDKFGIFFRDALAPAASGAFFLVKEYLGQGRLTFGIVTPLAI